MDDIKGIQERIEGLMHNSYDEIKSDMRILIFKKKSYEQMYERISKNPKAKRAILDEIEDTIIAIEDTLAIADIKLRSAGEMTLSVSDVN